MLQRSALNRPAPLYLTLFLLLAVSVTAVSAADDAARSLDKKRTELAEREESLRKEEDRLRTLRKEVDERTERYGKLLDRIEEMLKAVERKNGERLEHIIKAYEAMPAEEAAARLSAMDESTAIRILLRLKGKKAGEVIAAMEPKKAAGLTESMANLDEKFSHQVKSLLVPK